MRLSEIAETVCLEVVRDGQFFNLGLLSHRGNGVIAGYYDRHFLPVLAGNPDISCVIATPALAGDVPPHVGLAIADDAKYAFYTLHEHLHRCTDFYWSDFPTEIAADAQVHETAYVAQRNVRIGPGTIIEPRAMILERCLIGSNVVIRAGAIVGGEGFEPKWVGSQHRNISHAGGVRIGDAVHVCSGVHIARSVFGGFTEIGSGTMLDGVVHIAHNAKVGRCCEIAANVVVAGSATIGDRVWIGPNACISSEVEIGDDAFISLGSVVIHSVPAGGRVSGYFAFDHKKYKESWKRFREVE